MRQAIAMVADLQQGKPPAVNDDHSYNNGVKIVPAYLLEPLIVTQANARAAYAQDPILSRIVNP